MMQVPLTEATELARRLQSVSPEAPWTATSSLEPTLVDWFIDPESASGAPSFIRELVRELNVTFANGCYTACAMTLRRLTETLLVEAFERTSKAKLIQNGSGDWLTLEGIIAVAQKPDVLGLTRGARRGLGAVKVIGDLGSHDRHFIAKRPHLTRHQIEVDVAIQGLLAICGLR